MDAMQRLEDETHLATVIIQNLRDLGYIGSGDAEDDDVLLIDTLHGETGFLEAIDVTLELRALALANAVGLADVIGRLQARKKRLEDRAEGIKQIVLAAMQAADIKKLQRPIGTLSRVPVQRSALVLDEAAIPAKYWKAGEPKLDKRGLLADLKDGATIEGATLSNGGETLRIA